MTSHQFFIMRALSSRSPISNSESWNSWSTNWQPSHRWHGSTSFVGDTRCGNSSSSVPRTIPTLSHNLQLCQNSSPSSLIRLPRLTLSQSDRRYCLDGVSPGVGAVAHSCGAGNSCQCSASDLLLFLHASATSHITCFVAHNFSLCLCLSALFRFCASVAVYKFTQIVVV